MKKFVFLLFCLFNLCFLKSQSPSSLCTTFFNLYEVNSDSAFDYVMATSHWITPDSAKWLGLRSQIKNDDLGVYKGYELIQSEQIGSNVEILGFLVKYQNQDIQLRFQFYKPSKKWALHAIKYYRNPEESEKTSPLAVEF